LQRHLQVLEGTGSDVSICNDILIQLINENFQLGTSLRENEHNS